MADFGEILLAAGDFGLFQKLLLFALCFPNIMLSFHVTSLVFNQASVSPSFHHCNTDWILAVGPNLIKEEQLNLTVPQLQDGSFSMCEMFAPVDWSLEDIRLFGLNKTTGCMHGYVHDFSLFDSTIFDLVSASSYTIYMHQDMVQKLLYRATQISVVTMTIGTYATGLSPNIYVYMASQFIVGISYGGFRINSVILATEWIGMKKRAYAACLGQVMAALGQCILVGIVYFIRDWRTAQFIMGAPILLTCIYIWFIPESARWLLDRGRTEECKKGVLKAAAINKRTVPDALLMKVCMGVALALGSFVLRKYFLTLVFAWAALNLAYTSLSLNVGKFGMDIFITQLIFGLTEVPAHLICLWLLELVGRKPSLMSTLLVGGTMCLVSVFIPEGTLQQNFI
uniref:Uncharacterized protein n=1 Tax=Denticeps clupeoides TaxID=299321 RepID=A0AAY4A459_9TELE